MGKVHLRSNLFSWLPNSITLVRILLLMPFFAYPDYRLLLAVIIVGGDLLDGWIARRLNVTSWPGSILDTVADTLFIYVSWIILYVEGRFSLLVLLLLLLPRILTGLSLLVFYAIAKRWIIHHLNGDRLSAVAHYLGIFWLLAQLPLAQHIPVLVLIFSFTGVAMGFFERWKRLTSSSL